MSYRKTNERGHNKKRGGSSGRDDKHDGRKHRKGTNDRRKRQWQQKSSRVDRNPKEREVREATKELNYSKTKWLIRGGASQMTM